MSGRIARTLRVVRNGEPKSRPVDYWRKRSFEERLRETLSLHREGNELFKGGNPAFVFELRIREVVDER